MMVAIHQPTFFPWLGFFDKILRSERFVLYDTCRSDSKLGWVKRVRIIKNFSDSQWLGFSVKKVHKNKEGLYPKLYEHEIPDFEEQKSRHLRIIRGQYLKHPFFDDVYGIVERIYSNELRRLTEFNINAILTLCQYLDIDISKIIYSRDLGIDAAGNEFNLLATRACKGSIYLSGDGSGGYINERLFSDNGVGLEYQSFNHPRYKQLHSEEFIPGLSVIDALMNTGFEGVKALLLEK